MNGNSRRRRIAAQHTRAAEAGVLSLWLGAVACAVYGAYVTKGGFLADAWAILAIYEFAPEEPLGATRTFLEVAVLRPRPLSAFYLVALNATLGAHVELWLVWLTALGVLMSVVVYVLLRELRIGRLDAGVVATLLLIFPAASSIRLWTAVAPAPLTIVLTVLGFMAALRAFGAAGSRRTTWHAISLTLFASSLLLYETTLPIMLASVLLYRLRVPWGAAVRRWLVDCAVLAPLALIVKRSGPAPWEVQSTAGSLEHARTIWEESQTLLTTVVLPLGTDRWYVLALLGLIPLGAALVAKRLFPADPVRAELRRWLLVGLGGAIVVGLGYLMFVPAIDYYAPMSPGVGNRVNTVPSIGWVLVVYAAIRLTATTALRRPRARRLMPATVLAASALIAVGWLQAIARDAETFERAYLEGQRVAGMVVAAVPDPPADSTIWTFGQPVQIAPGFPVFGNTWDMTSRIQLVYDDPTLSGFVGYGGTRFRCGRREIVPYGHYYYRPDEPRQEFLHGAYGRTYFVDTTSGRAERLDTPAHCRRAARSFVRSPEYPS